MAQGRGLESHGRLVQRRVSVDSRVNGTDGFPLEGPQASMGLSVTHLEYREALTAASRYCRFSELAYDAGPWVGRRQETGQLS